MPPQPSEGYVILEQPSEGGNSLSRPLTQNMGRQRLNTDSKA